MRKVRFELVLGVGIMALAGAFAPACKSDGGEGSGGTGGSGGSTTANGGGTGGSGGSGGSTVTNSGGTGGSGGDTGVVCGPGAELCGASCTVTSIDPKNCGKCGNACADGQSCDGGSCVLECHGGSTKCGDSCVETDSDPSHCGKCDAACGALEVCSKGTCSSVCAEGTMACGRACVDAMSDAKNCGQCANACGAAEMCLSGKCVTPEAPKAVYVMTNDAAGNKILSFERAADGSLSPSGQFTATGGTGTGAGLGNQHGLIFDAAQNLFFAVNAGNDTVSMLSLHTDGKMELLSNVPSGGARPVSVTVSGSVVYVLNAGVAGGAAGNITGFQITGNALMPIAGSTQPLSAANPGPAQIQFAPDGKTLVVTEKGTSMLDTYAVTNGVASPPVTKVSAGQTPFGFDFSAKGQVIVSEAWGGQAGMSSASSYSIGANGALTTVSGAVPTTRTAACWLVVAGTHAYVANAQTSDVTGFTVADSGMLTMLNPDGVTGKTLMGATDEDVTDDNGFLYVVNSGAHLLSIFQINADGSLAKKPDFLGLPTTSSGLVAR